MGRISVDLPDELEKQLRLKTVERFGGKKGDLSKAVEEAVRTWIAKITDPTEVPFPRTEQSGSNSTKKTESITKIAQTTNSRYS